MAWVNKIEKVLFSINIKKKIYAGVDKISIMYIEGAIPNYFSIFVKKIIKY